MVCSFSTCSPLCLISFVRFYIRFTASGSGWHVLVFIAGELVFPIFLQTAEVPLYASWSYEVFNKHVAHELESSLEHYKRLVGGIRVAFY